MLKIKDNVDLKELEKYYGLNYEEDSDYESGWSYQQYDKDDVFIDIRTRKISGIENGSLDLLYDLIKDDLVEKVE